MDPLSPEELILQYKTLDIPQKERVSEILIKETGKIRRRKPNKETLTHKVIGKLIFMLPDSDSKIIPLHHMYLELWDRDIGNPDDYLGSGETAADGSFEIYYNPADAGSFDTPDLELRVFEERHRFDALGNPRNKKRLIYSFEGADNVRDEIYPFGTLELPYWEYDKDALTPRVLIPEQGRPPEAYEPGRNLKKLQVFPQAALLKIHEKLQNGESIDSVQNDYNKLTTNKTIKEENKYPNTTRSDEYLGKNLLNGMIASVMDKDPGNPDRYWIYHHWNSYEQDGIYAMPNVDIKLEKYLIEGAKKEKREILKPVEITLGMRKRGEKKPHAEIELVKVTPEDGDKWKQAKRIARVSASLTAELDAHLCSTHLNTEQYAIAAYRNIRKNPVRYLLFPHIKEVCLVNDQANTFLLGENGYITRASGFTKDSINKHIEQVMGTLDWKNWQPRKAISKNHRYAHATQLFWEVLTEFVDWYFAKYEEEISAQWIEIKRFSDDLVEHSVPDFFCKWLDRNFKGKKKKDITWMDWNERMDIDEERASNGKGTVAVSAITKVESNPSKQDLENLKQVCKYVMHHATLVHSWSNSQQYDEGGELRFTSLGLRYGDSEAGLFVDESDDSILPPPKDASWQLFISYFLSSSNYGFILKNEERDIHPKFIELLKKKKKGFTDIHPSLNIAKIPSRTNI